MKIIISRVEDVELTHDDLVNLLSFCTDGGDGTLGLEFRRQDYIALPKEVRGDDDCLEDKAAKILLAGGTIRVIDWDADGVAYNGAYLQAKIVDEAAYYPVTLQNIKDGLVNAVNGDIITWQGGTSDIKNVRESFDRFAEEDSPDFDADDAKTLRQVILFNELIYG